MNLSHYKEEFITRVNSLAKEDVADKDERIRRVNELIEEYIEKTGEIPRQYQIMRLTNFILKDDLAEKGGGHKVKNNEYPILGKKAIQRRHHLETSLNTYEDVIGSDGKSKKPPTRRERTKYENMVVDGELKDPKRGKKKSRSE